MRATDRHPPIGNLLYSLGPRFCDRDQARRAPAGLGPSGNDQGHGKMVGRLLAPAVVFEASPRYSRAEAPGCAQTCPAPFYAAFQAPGVASGGARGRALRAYGFHRYAAEPPFFSLPRVIPRLLLGACDGGSEGDGQVRALHRFPRP